MLFSIIALFAFAQLGATSPSAGVPQTDVLGDRSAPARTDRVQIILCGCASAAPADLTVEGLVVDAEVLLGPDGRSALDRQATVFNVLPSTRPDRAGDVKGRTRIFHSTAERKCGVAFDYGKNYRVPVRRTEDGALETDFCLIQRAREAVDAAGGEAPALKVDDQPG